MTRIRIALGVSLVAALAGSFAALGASASARGDAPSMSALEDINFISSCRFSHRAPDDPIVFPGQAGKSHDHTFVGNRTTGASSTLESLLAGATTCHRPADRAAYWMPTLIVGSRSVEPVGATIYYRRRTLSAVRPFPLGFRMIAGDAVATLPQQRRVTFWNCGVPANVPRSSAVPTCPAGRGTHLRLHVTFPNCWDGRNLDSADHRSHMAYSVRGHCPVTHPFAMPAISTIFRYPVAGGPSVRLASGGPFSGHADFFNAWDSQGLAKLVDGCLNALRHCGRAS